MAHDILIVDDQDDIRMLAAGILEDEGHQTRGAHDRATALASIESRRPSLVLLDIWLESPLEGMEILETICTSHPTVPVVMMSGHGNIETAVSAINIGAFDFIEKPFTADRLLLVVTRAIENAELKRENAELRQRAGGDVDLIGNSNAISQLRQSIERVASANSRVLITGPAGSGKDVIARLLHKNSTRSSGPFVSLNCATMNPDNFETSLFGRESADTGKAPREIGTFEQAHNGTLFLDEVADMPLETQGKIVRVLQEQTFQRVGGATFIEVDVRVIAAATKDLTESMSEGNFREDLFYRLSVVPIEIPPLRDYREDIPALAEFFMTQMAETTGRPQRTFSEDAIATLQAYGWPGNVRELRNVIERILIMAPGDESDQIRSDMIPAEVSLGNAQAQGGLDSTEFMGLPLREAREIFEREYLEAQVSRFGGNISKTASFIGMERSALHRKLKSLGFQSDERAQAAND
ncbi:MAG: sigma-54-dependent Fis family transcriptional regulator [Rhodospirillaceae bacterium]|jgi:two-component system, NtrC family, nitrogen regulation response regulator NtrX|nr:sigma-54-dependent Fis family transcriptional regulator [Rhodospirillaceae bacterium]MBT4940159.1 sigma-54-dependent Fis family transcriptional regulator [Rhodospirillaceae bacterium]MBT5939083.1 sigma-54-dependent Fis family transcriptional regulator [Rhodospirillaceae bacterium]MBT7267013.1 sigma-54-dependent Fis family transcriptional regulator [Rhodospirillaceae bacterium]